MTTTMTDRFADQYANDPVWNPDHPNYLGDDPTIEQLRDAVENYPYEQALRMRGAVHTLTVNAEDDEQQPQQNPNGTRTHQAPSAAQRMYALRLAYEATRSFNTDGTVNLDDDSIIAQALDAIRSEKTNPKQMSSIIDTLKGEREQWTSYARSKDLNDSDPMEAVKTLEARLQEKARAEFAPKEIEVRDEASAVGTVAPIDGYYTIVLGTERRTLRISTAGERSRLAGKRIVSYLAGPDNQFDYQGFGFVEGSDVKIWKRYTDDSLLVEAVKVLVADPKAAAEAYALESENCYVCGRKLTTPESIESGIGPVCEMNGGF